MKMTDQDMNKSASTGETCVYKQIRKFDKIAAALSVYIAIVFVQSLFYKFSDAPETQYIFATLDSWAAGFLTDGLFVPGGIFSAKVIGSLELISSLSLIAALISGRVILRVFGAAVALAIISGAIFFHLFTPLGVEVQGDGGLLFALACGVWISAAILLYRERTYILDVLTPSPKK